MELSNLNIKEGLCISLGANIDSKFGKPIDSLIQSKIKIEKIIYELLIKNLKDKLKDNELKKIFNWSSLYKTSPVGIKKSQPDYINCVLLVKSSLLPSASNTKAMEILQEFKNLEKEFGRDKDSEEERWLPRALDVDLLWWDNLNINNEELILPHPRFKLRNFVISPLAEILSSIQKIEKLNINRWIID